MTPVVVLSTDIPPKRLPGGALGRTLVSTSADTTGLVKRLIEIPPAAGYSGQAGRDAGGGAGGAGELWFVLGGSGRLEVDGQPDGGRRLSARQGVLLPEGARFRVVADGPEPLRLDISMLGAPATGQSATGGDGGGGGGAAEDGGARVADLADCEVQVTGDREFRVLFGPANGCAAATQFVGEIPPGRAPVHQHTYDEIVLILAGSGVLHAGDADLPLAPGTCIHLPPGTPHCLENTARDNLTVLGVFHPGGSPASKT
jgi:mannose-6-phosphate isomerase-like protein (cupin superfamily)